MSRSYPAAVFANAIAALFLFIVATLAGDPLRAEPLGPNAPVAIEPGNIPIKPALDFGDEIATLDAILIALTEAQDGSAYVWQRHHGRLNGTVRMTNTFRDGDGRICRHMVMSLAAGRYTRRTEGIACRSRDGVWSLEG